MKKKIDFPSELRMDLVSKDWVIISSIKAKKPHDFKKGRKLKKCPFCDIGTQHKPVLFIPDDKDWAVAVVPNKYPALVPHFKLEERKEGGLYKKMNAVGFHEVIITRDHKKQLADLSVKRVRQVIDAYQARYLDMKGRKFVNHISIFHNHGPLSGASLAHPHSQMITTFLLDVDLKNALSRAKKYHKDKKRCLYCDMIKYDLKVKKRIVFENKSFVALCPFASKTSFQVAITPKKHLSYFEDITSQEKEDLAEVFKKVLFKIKKGLNNPSYNFYLHTAPADNKKHDYYHWHFTVLPKMEDWSGFEIGTRLEIISTSPEQAAEYLRKI